MDWQPIETAPKDGTRILGRHSAYPNGIQLKWDQRQQEWWADPMPMVLGAAQFAPDPTEWAPIPPHTAHKER